MDKSSYFNQVFKKNQEFQILDFYSNVFLSELSQTLTIVMVIILNIYRDENYFIYIYAMRYYFNVKYEH